VFEYLPSYSPELNPVEQCWQMMKNVFMANFVPLLGASGGGPFDWQWSDGGACKNLIDRRLKQTGARWRVCRANRMATLCAVLYGDQWNLYWDTAK